MKPIIRQNGGRPRSSKALLTSIAVIAAVLLAVAALLALFTDPLLNRYAKGRIEAAFAEAYPGYALTIGSIHYSIAGNVTECRDVRLAAADSSINCRARSITVNGIGWHELAAQGKLTPDVVKRSAIAADDIAVRLGRRRYEIRCASMRIAMADSEVAAAGASMEFEHARYRLRIGTFRASMRNAEIDAGTIVLEPLAGDGDFFSARPYRRTRFALSIEHASLHRAPLRAMLSAKAMTGGTLEIVRPELAILVNRDKPSNPNAPPPVMPGEALAQLGRPFRLDTLLVRDGRLAYAERVTADGKPGILTFDTVQISAFNIANSPRATVLLRAQGRFMNAGLMSVVMHIPLRPDDFSLSYTGSLTAMDFTSLNRFLETAEHTRISSAMVHDAAFNVRVAHGRGSGTLRISYDDLSVTLLDKETGSSHAVGTQIKSFFANLVKIRGSNMPDRSDPPKTGSVKYTRDPTDTFMNITWLSLRSAVQDVVGF